MPRPTVVCKSKEVGATARLIVNLECMGCCQGLARVGGRLQEDKFVEPNVGCKIRSAYDDCNGDGYAELAGRE